MQSSGPTLDILSWRGELLLGACDNPGLTLLSLSLCLPLANWQLGLQQGVLVDAAGLAGALPLLAGSLRLPHMGQGSGKGM